MYSGPWMCLLVQSWLAWPCSLSLVHRRLLACPCDLLSFVFPLFVFHSLHPCFHSCSLNCRYNTELTNFPVVDISLTTAPDLLALTNCVLLVHSSRWLSNRKNWQFHSISKFEHVQSGQCGSRVHSIFGVRSHLFEQEWFVPARMRAVWLLILLQICPLAQHCGSAPAWARWSSSI